MQQAQQYELIAVRIKDGIFAGNAVAAEDREFLGMNKISHIINCSGGEVADFFQNDPELKYLSFPWKDTAGSVCTTVLFDPADDTITRAVNFIDEALAGGHCVLVHSYYGVSRSPALIAAFFIIKYGWKLESALSFLQMAHQDVSIKPHFMRQLRLFAKRHPVDHDVFDKAVDDSVFGLDNDQWMLRNTLLNGLSYQEQQTSDLYSQCAGRVDVGTILITSTKAGGAAHGRISFIDTRQGTHVASADSTPVIQAKSVVHHIDPNATQGSSSGRGKDASGQSMVGVAGAAALVSGVRSPSILSRSTSPCTRRLESDSSTCPKGRQTLKLVVDVTKEPQPIALSKRTSESSLTVARTDSSQSLPKSAMGTAAAADAMGSSPAPRQPSTGSTSSKVSHYERLVPPRSGAAASHHSPFATLTAKHKYRNGSPLPLFGKNAKANNNDKPKNSTSTVGGRTRISSSPSSRPLGAPSSPTTRTGSPGTASLTGSPRGGSSGRTGSPTSTNIRGRAAPPPAAGVVRGMSSGYRAIAPQRSNAATTLRTAWNSDRRGPERPSLSRPLSPSMRMPNGTTSPRPAGSPRSGSATSSPRTSSLTKPRSGSSGAEPKARTRSRDTAAPRPGPGGSGSGGSRTGSADRRKSPGRTRDGSANGKRSGAPPATASSGASANNSVRRDAPAAIPSRRQ